MDVISRDSGAENSTGREDDAKEKGRGDQENEYWKRDRDIGSGEIKNSA